MRATVPDPWNTPPVSDAPRARPVDPPDLPASLAEDTSARLASGASFEDVHLVGLDLGSDDDERIVDVAMSGCRLTGAVLTGAQLRAVSLVDVVLEDCELSGATVDAATFERVRFERCRMSGFVAPQLVARHTTFDDCRLDGAWLRMATLERCAFDDCDLGQADLYAARVTESRFLRCRLDETEWSEAALDDVALHRSTFDGLRGAVALRNCTISSDQVVDLAGPVFAALGIVVDDDYLDGA